MKILSLVLFCCSVMSLMAQSGSSYIVIKQTLHGQRFALNAPMERNGAYHRVERLAYYLSEMELEFENGHVLMLSGMYWLVIPASSEQYLDLGELIDRGRITAVRFNIGVDPEHNHADPSVYPFTHPLALQNPSMHWGWSGGYRFAVIEGYTGPTPTSLTTNYQMHTVGDEHYLPVALTVSSSFDNSEHNRYIINVNAEYANVLNGIDISQGVINHSNEGEAATMIQNFASQVFTGGTTSDVNDDAARGDGFDNGLRYVTFMSAFPNPSRDIVSMTSTLPDRSDVVLMDLMGREVARTAVLNGRATFDVSSCSPGIYTAVASHDRELESGRVVVAR